jgi:hypothetical protein
MAMAGPEMALVMDVFHPSRAYIACTDGGRTGMSNETETGIRSNFASRLLNKAIAERTRTTGEHKKITVAEAAKYAVSDSTGIATAEPVAAAKE